jgi:predicted dithiol-disulfide oxidoreductase (DUF899 family)
MKKHKRLPRVVSQAEWQAARDKLLRKEKAHTRARDALAAERRRLPMVRIDKSYVFAGSDGKARLVDLFDGRRQLILYHFMFAPGVDGWPEAGCPGCSFVVDHIGHLAHLHARNTSLVLVSRAPFANIKRYRRRMGWAEPWFSSSASDFNRDFGLTTDRGETFGLSVFLRDGLSHVFHERARRRGAWQPLDVSRPDAIRPAGDLGRLTQRVAADATVSMVAATR